MQSGWAVGDGGGGEWSHVGGMRVECACRCKWVGHVAPAQKPACARCVPGAPPHGEHVVACVLKVAKHGACGCGGGTLGQVQRSLPVNRRWWEHVGAP